MDQLSEATPTALKSLPSDLSLNTADLSDTEHSQEIQAREKVPDRIPSKVSFGFVHIREFNRIVGDHPDTSAGPPITFDWQHTEREPVELTTYEENRPKKRIYLRLSSITRKNMLKNVFGIDEKEIAASEKEVQKIRKQRESTFKQGKVGKSMEAASRKIKKRFSTKNLLKGLTAMGSMSNAYAMS
eukprot:CAMPEP_0172455970 /NCGR_PEP_ID=MMETSP1065-20121228/13452_1 /TAXON_ID=265537 /ORGANISM="Amphiprora paludosa, Strain CCMP125" /LENGTH=185 /DNA_ID=CAMNT_0013208541 /DNA_START=66 /DNA_END=623 /DNA_ORIENTATION=+